MAKARKTQHIRSGESTLVNNTKPRRQCLGLAGGVRPCESFAVRASGYCVRHDPAFSAEEKQEWSKRRPPLVEDIKEEIIIKNENDLKAFYVLVINLLLKGKLPISAANACGFVGDKIRAVEDLKLQRQALKARSHLPDHRITINVLVLGRDGVEHRQVLEVDAPHTPPVAASSRYDGVPAIDGTPSESFPPEPPDGS